MTSELRERYKRWIKYFRQNPEEFVEQILGITLLDYQKFILHNAMLSDSSFLLQCRGSAKSFITGLMAVCQCLLYPGSKVVCSASVEAQASLLITSKIEDELFRLSPYLRELKRNNLVEFCRSEAGAAMIIFHTNGSTIIGAAPIASSRGLRATMVIIDECRLVQQQAISSIILPMRMPRVPVYAEGEGRSAYENAKVVLLTSSGLHHEPWVRTFQQHIMRAVQPGEKQRLKYFVCAFDIYACVLQGAKSIEDLESLRENTDTQSFQIECENMILGHIQDGAFDSSMLQPAQKIMAGLKRQKTEDEWRVIAIDLAFQSKSDGTNDNTIITCCSVDIVTGMRRLDWIATHEASDNHGLVTRVHEVFQQYDADLIIFDARSGGRVFAQLLMDPISVYQPYGLADSCYQMINSNTLSDYALYQQEDVEAYCLVPYIATSQSNDAMWTDMLQQLRIGKWLLPHSAAQAEDIFLNDGSFYEMTSEEYAEKMAPYIQTDLMIDEALNLKASQTSNGLMKLSEPRNSTKDRVVAWCYANDIIGKIIQSNQFVKYEQQNWLEQFDCWW